ncbi:MAG: acyltransferase [Bacteroidota bacterium]
MIHKLVRLAKRMREEGFRPLAVAYLGLFSRRWRGGWLRRRTGLRGGRGLQANGPVFVREGWRVTAGGDVYLGENTALEGAVTLGDRVYVGAGCQLKAITDITIGEGTLLAPYVWISDYEHGVAPDLPVSEQIIGRQAAVAIGRDCWLGYGAVIMSGSQIGDGAVIGANAVVTAGTVVPAGEIWVGNPARFLRSRSKIEAAG